MNTGTQAAWSLALLLALATSAWFFAKTTPVNFLDDDTLSNTTDISIRQLTLQQFNTQGQLANFMQTPLLTHIQHDNTHIIHQPHIIVSKTNQSSWEINAKKAIALHGGQQITFSEQVVIHQESPHATTIQTEELTYFPHDQHATTQQKILITQLGNQLQAIGMHAWFAENRVQLLHQARAIYVANQG